jgi:hypothetical protein
LASQAVAGLLIMLLSCHEASGQLKWELQDSLFGPLPPEVHVYKTSSPLNGRPNTAYYISLPLESSELDFTTQVGRGKRFTPSQFYTQEDSPLVVVNGTYFSFADNRNLNLVIRNGMLQAYNLPAVPAADSDSGFYYITRGAIGIDKKKKADVAWVYTDTAQRYAYALLNGPSKAWGTKPDPEWPDIRRQLPGGGRKKIRWKMETAIGGGPVLIHMGKTLIT